MTPTIPMPVSSGPIQQSFPIPLPLLPRLRAIVRHMRFFLVQQTNPSRVYAPTAMIEIFYPEGFTHDFGRRGFGYEALRSERDEMVIDEEPEVLRDGILTFFAAGRECFVVDKGVDRVGRFGESVFRWHG
ncbi:hypothetical protein D9757_014319 [Collybiopsis confluens]|uniref:Uncharacterized protein n=1 Tax=Collybiopsis confluens TaxID=2823264 RepID=A0A8H5CT00_9AGAR|nr:hypothetical protein D9757_014319 [Collybiopsis confluens]